MAQARAAVDALWRAWAALRDGKIAAIAPELERVGGRPIAIPPEKRLVVRPPAGGEALP